MVSWNMLSVSNEWMVWIFLSVALVVLYFALRHLVWKGERPEERIILKKFIIVFIVSIIITIFVIYVLKFTFQVPRPCIPCTEGVTDCNPYCPEPWDYSFPSGHAGTVFVLFTSFFMIYRKKEFIPFFVFPVIVAYSRVFFGVHSYVDVIAGSLIGIVIPVIVWKTERIFKVLKA